MLRGDMNPRETPNQATNLVLTLTIESAVYRSRIVARSPARTQFAITSRVGYSIPSSDSGKGRLASLGYVGDEKIAVYEASSTPFSPFGPATVNWKRAIMRVTVDPREL